MSELNFFTMKHILILLISLLSFSNIYAQISGDDIIDPLWSDNEVCVYLKDFSTKIDLVIYNNYEDFQTHLNFELKRKGNIKEINLIDEIQNLLIEDEKVSKEIQDFKQNDDEEE